MFPATPVVLNETMLRQLDAFCEFGVYARNRIAAKHELFVLYAEGAQLLQWRQTLETLKKFPELDLLRYEVEEAFDTCQSMM